MSAEDAGVVRQTFEAFQSGGFDAMLPYFSDDVVWHTAPGWVEEPLYRGHEGTRMMSAVWTDNFDDLALQPQEVRDLGDRVLVLAEASGRAKDTGALVRQPYAMLYSDFRDGKIGEVRFYFTWQEGLDAAASQQ